MSRDRERYRGRYKYPPSTINPYTRGCLTQGGVSDTRTPPCKVRSVYAWRGLWGRVRGRLRQVHWGSLGGSL